MSDPKPDLKRRPLKNLPPDRFPEKVSLIWLSIIAAVVALYLFSPAHTAVPATLKLQQVIELAEQEQVASGVIRYDVSYGRNGATLTGKIKTATLDSETGKTDQFRASGNLTESNLEILQKSKVFEEPPVSNAWSNTASRFTRAPCPLTTARSWLWTANGRWWARAIGTSAACASTLKSIWNATTRP